MAWIRSMLASLCVGSIGQVVGTYVTWKSGSHSIPGFPA